MPVCISMSSVLCYILWSANVNPGLCRFILNETLTRWPNGLEKRWVALEKLFTFTLDQLILLIHLTRKVYLHSIILSFGFFLVIFHFLNSGMVHESAHPPRGKNYVGHNEVNAWFIRALSCQHIPTFHTFKLLINYFSCLARRVFVLEWVREVPSWARGSSGSFASGHGCRRWCHVQVGERKQLIPEAQQTRRRGHVRTLSSPVSTRCF